MTTETIDPNRLIEAFGGNSVIARELDISSQAVSRWRHAGVSDARLKYFKLKDANKYATALTVPAQGATETVATQAG